MVQWLREDFISYLEEWKKSVDARSKFSDSEKAKMQLSIETLEGLKMTGMWN